MWHIYKLLIKIFGKEKIIAYIKSRSERKRQQAFRAHKLQMDLEWGFPPQPEWFDHYCDLFYQWRETRISYWAERGIYGLLTMEQNCNVLELCCGDGFNAYHFYSARASHITSVDFDHTAITHATKYNKAPNITFQLCDIRTNMPDGIYDNVIWDAAIEHFTQEEISSILNNIKKRLKPGGILSGYTLKEDVSGKKSLTHHEYEFKSLDDLKKFLTPYFKNVKVFETIHPTRHNLYFYASDAELPFDKNWKHMVTVS